MTWVEWLEFAHAHWAQLLGALFIAISWSIWLGLTCYNKGAREHGCRAKISERTERE